MIDHKLAHATIDINVFAGDEACFFAAEEECQLGDICWRTNPPGRMLAFVLLGMYRVFSCVNPSRADAVYPRMTGKGYRHCVSKRYYTAFGGSVAFGVGL